MPKLNTCPAVDTLGSTVQILAIVPGTGDQFTTVLIPKAMLESGISAGATSVELSSNSTHILWRNVGDATWQDLIPLSSITGPQGLQGIQGETGATGATGAQGTGLTILGSLDNVGLLPASSTVGDGYIIGGNLHIWSGTAWNNMGSIQGPQGPQGIQGLKGDTGDAGPQGIQGIQGIQGPIGPAGPAGTNGTDGVDGVDGVDGADAVTIFTSKGSQSGGTQVFDLNTCDMWGMTVAGSLTVSITNWPASGILGELCLELVNAGAHVITWPAGIRWVKADGSFTTDFATSGQTLQSAGTDFILFWTRDGGSTVWAKVLR